VRVLVTGNRGYLGTAVVPTLLEAGHEVTGLDLDLYSRCTFLEAKSPDITTLNRDIRDVTADDLAGYSAVVHLAALSNDALGDLSPELTDDINRRASVRLAKLARAAGVRRFLFASSCSVYGSGSDDLLDESGPVCPLTPYARSKAEAEEQIAALGGDGFSPTFLRCGTACGASSKIRFDLVVNNLVAWAASIKRVVLKSQGTSWRPVVHVRDIAAAFKAALEAPPDLVRNEIFNVGSTGQNFQVIELAQLVASLVPGCHVDLPADAPEDQRSYRVGCDKIEEALPEARARWTVKRAVRELYLSYVPRRLTVEEFEGPSFSRAPHLRSLISAGVVGHDLRAEECRNGGASSRFRSAICRSCAHAGLDPILDLGSVPPSDALVAADDVGRPQPSFPLELGRCPECTLVQIVETVEPRVLFGPGYRYLSSCSDGVVENARNLAENLMRRRPLGPRSLVLEVGSNDGYLLRRFQGAGHAVLGVDPAPVPVARARAKGVRTLGEYFGLELARRLQGDGIRPDIIVANNVLAHIADTNGAVAGIKELIDPAGLVAIEVPYVRDLIDGCEFDTIYHEHLCYFSLFSADALLRRHGLYVNDVERLPIHGGSLRLFAETTENPAESVSNLLREEHAAGLGSGGYYERFAWRVEQSTTEVRELLRQLRASGARIAAYGAAAKGTILLNQLGAAADLIDYVVDRNPDKQGLYMPGVQLRICDPSPLVEDPPDYLLILAWNHSDEIIGQLSEFQARGGRFILPIPELRIV